MQFEEMHVKHWLSVTLAYQLQNSTVIQYAYIVGHMLSDQLNTICPFLHG